MSKTPLTVKRDILKLSRIRVQFAELRQISGVQNETERFASIARSLHVPPIAKGAERLIRNAVTH